MWLALCSIFSLAAADARSRVVRRHGLGEVVEVASDATLDEACAGPQAGSSVVVTQAFHEGEAKVPVGTLWDVLAVDSDCVVTIGLENQLVTVSNEHVKFLKTAHDSGDQHKGGKQAHPSESGDKQKGSEVLGPDEAVKKDTGGKKDKGGKKKEGILEKLKTLGAVFGPYGPFGR